MQNYDSHGSGRITRFELPFCFLCNRVRNRAVLRLFSIVSRLGNGLFWAAIATLILLTEERSGPVLRDMVVTCLVDLAIYESLKARTARPRPFALRRDFHLTVPPLDDYSFPSGHTLHAVAFTCVLSAHHSEFFWVALPFTALVAISRVVLGLHFPTDVLAGIVLGAAVASLVVLA